jgi:hypothetical protein
MCLVEVFNPCLGQKAFGERKKHAEIGIDKILAETHD